MKDIRKTIRHTFRRSLGYKLYGVTASIKKKFPDEIEEKLNDYFEENITIAYIEILFGRLEIEEYLIEEYPDQVLNK